MLPTHRSQDHRCFLCQSELTTLSPSKPRLKHTRQHIHCSPQLCSFNCKVSLCLFELDFKGIKGRGSLSSSHDTCVSPPSLTQRDALRASAPFQHQKWCGRAGDWRTLFTRATVNESPALCLGLPAQPGAASPASTAEGAPARSPYLLRDLVKVEELEMLYAEFCLGTRATEEPSVTCGHRWDEQGRGSREKPARG